MGMERVQKGHFPTGDAVEGQRSSHPVQIDSYSGGGWQSNDTFLFIVVS